MKRATALLALVLVACSQGPAAPPASQATAAIPIITPAETSISEPSLTPEPTPVPTIAAEPLTIEGTNDGKTEPFEIVAGTYIVVATGESTALDIENVIIVIFNEKGDSLKLFHEIVDGPGSWSFEAIEYGYPDDQYHLDVTAPAGTWSVTFNPKPNL